MKVTKLSAGKFAQLARTTKRTILWYEKMGILLPTGRSENGYRTYAPEQIIDFQILSLLRTLGFSIDEISVYLKHGNNLMAMFADKRIEIARQIESLNRLLSDLEGYNDSLSSVGLLVKPNIRYIEPIQIAYREKRGSYAHIGEYCKELSRYVSYGGTATYFTIFNDSSYSPGAANMKIGVVVRPGMVIDQGDETVKLGALPGYTALTTEHRGSGALLSLLWTELGTYRRKHKLKPARHTDFYEMELYHAISGSDDMNVEMHLPIEALR